MKNAARGKLRVVGNGFGLTVTTIKKTIGKRQKMTCKTTGINQIRKQSIIWARILSWLLYLHP